MYTPSHTQRHPTLVVFLETTLRVLPSAVGVWTPEEASKK